MKKIYLSFLLVLLPLFANADPVEIDGIYYNLVSKAKAAEVTKNPNFYSGKVAIPETITYNGVKYSVTSLGEGAFYGCSSLQSVTIPNSVTTIRYCAFEECTALTSVNIPNSVTSIGECAFRNCEVLSFLTIPNNVTYIDYGAFWG